MCNPQGNVMAEGMILRTGEEDVSCSLLNSTLTNWWYQAATMLLLTRIRRETCFCSRSRGRVRWT